MKAFIIASLLVLGACSSTNHQPVVAAVESKEFTGRTPASADTKKLLEMNERRGCCSHHGGVSHCSFGTLYCNDGSVSGCGC